MATEDTMENGWGVQFVTHTERRCGRRTFTNFQADIEKAVPGFTLDSVHMCGTDANAVAISLATDRDYKTCLFGLGSYIGGDECHQSLSSSSYHTSAGLAGIKPFNEASPQCQRQSVMLPYHVPCLDLDKTSLRVYENRCLVHLHQVLLHAEMTGNQYKALLLEYVLGGNGGELSLTFLDRLGQLLKHFHIVVVADEILTAGRTGKTIAMTTNMPATFTERIFAITMGKFVGCGLVLTRKTKYTTFGESLRGFSTQAECGLPSKLLEEVQHRLDAGMLEERRRNVLKLMRCNGKGTEEDHWGCGLLIFTTYSRSLRMGLRNRCLPRLEKSKLIKKDATRSKWTRTTVCRDLMASVDEWILRQHLSMCCGEHVFTTGLISFVFYKMMTGGWNDEKEVCFRAEEVVEFLGPKGEIMADEHNNWQHRVNHRRTYAKAQTLVKRALIDGIRNTKFSRRLYRKRLRYERIECNVFDGRIFDIYAE